MWKQRRSLAFLLALSLFALSAEAAEKKTQKKTQKKTEEKTPKKAVSKVQQALFEAAAGEHASRVMEALKEGAKVNGGDAQGVTAISYAIVKNTFYGKEVIEALLKAKASVNAKDDDGMTPLMFAAQAGKNEHFPALLAAGAEVNARDKDGWTPLMYAAFYSSSFAVNDLLKAGADVKPAAADGRTALLLSVQHGHQTSVKALLDAGATFEGAQVKGSTPLILAAIGDDMSTMEEVLKTKPDVNARDMDGWTALMVAGEKTNPDNVMALLRAGADTALKDDKGLTALDHAKNGECGECAALLGGTWERRKPSGGTTVSVPCEPLGGPVDVNLAVEAGELALSAFYPKPIGAYLGGFESGVKKVSADVHVYLDTDNNAKTGLKTIVGVTGDLGMGGAEYEIDFSEIGTTVGHPVTGKNVNRQVLDPTISKGNDSLTSEQMNGYYPKVVRDMNAARLNVPLSVFGLKPGAKVRVTVRPGFCAPKSKVLTLG